MSAGARGLLAHVVRVAVGRFAGWRCRVVGHPDAARTVTGHTGVAVRAVCGACGTTGVLDAEGRLTPPRAFHDGA